MAEVEKAELAARIADCLAHGKQCDGCENMGCELNRAKPDAISPQ